jgi:hypothetical protein
MGRDAPPELAAPNKSDEVLLDTSSETKLRTEPCVVLRKLTEEGTPEGFGTSDSPSWRSMPMPLRPSFAINTPPSHAETSPIGIRYSRSVQGSEP